MLDSGASTSLAYKGESLVGYTPRPVPHVVALLPAESDNDSECAIAHNSCGSAPVGNNMLLDWQTPSAERVEERGLGRSAFLIRIFAPVG
jgi:hypothetical protein